jgi:MPBQ/MSBQ methyltransferase
MARSIQHKTEARWFYAVVSQGYDRWINPLFWTEPMREASLDLGDLEAPDVETIADVGAGTGFTTTGIVGRNGRATVTMVDQSPHQLAKARRKPVLDRAEKRLGDAEDLPFPTDSQDRYVSAGSIEYWPDPQRAICEAYRIVKPGGKALLVGPLARTHPVAKGLTDAWMLFPPEEDYVRWYEAAGFVDVEVRHIAPPWWKPSWDAYGLAIVGTKPEPGPSPLALPTPAPAEHSREVLGPRRLARFAFGSLAGAAMVPAALYFEGARRLGRNRTAQS